MAVNKNTYQEYKDEIIATRARGDQSWADLVSFKLRMADRNLGKDEANRLIRECHLEKDGWREEE